MKGSGRAGQGVCHDHRTAERIAMAADLFRQRMHLEIRRKLQRLRGEGAVDRDFRRDGGKIGQPQDRVGRRKPWVFPGRSRAETAAGSAQLPSMP
ncbi:hypothetical protein [Falsigemmobacter faecalis]|uniref:hypothetical protein n=1 Tax=Falsigemmobacter faecalis TaxID=2488730 RepID=UPI001F2B8ACB|nr:hypothetical protein [Falsigemmobacter faecalis]